MNRSFEPIVHHTDDTQVVRPSRSSLPDRLYLSPIGFFRRFSSTQRLSLTTDLIPHFSPVRRVHPLD